MQEAWSIIDVLLKKRYELVPRLVEIVEGYNLYERSQLETITRLRGEAMLEENRETKIKAESLFGKTIDHLFLHTEDYPELKANQLFLKLQIQLTELENELEGIAAAYPKVALPLLRHLVATARAERAKKSPPKAYRELFRYLKSLDNTEEHEQL